MKAYVIRQGDYLTKLAYTMGLDLDDVWNDPKNEALRDERPDHSILCPGDVLFVPDTQSKSLPLVGGTTNEFVATVPKITVEVRLLDCEGAPIAAEPYRVMDVPEADQEQKETDPEGTIRVEVAVHVRSVTISLERLGLTYEFMVGDLDPHDEPSGARQRLANLGYGEDALPDASDGGSSPNLALERFRRAAKSAATGDLGPGDHEALEKEHGS
jgi:hypothetical protein